MSRTPPPSPLASSRRIRPCRVIGIDFSAAALAGRKIWIAQGRRRDDGQVHVAQCDRLTDLLGVPASRDGALAALGRWIAQQRGALVGLDFPFAVPLSLMPPGESWQDWCLKLRQRFADATAFRADCVLRADGREFKRVTETTVKTPFASYNLRVFRQTFHGVREVLAPLVRADAVRVLPMQTRARSRPALIEICPASTLKALGAYLPRYKGQDSASTVEAPWLPSRQRADILARLRRQHGLSLTRQVCDRAIAEPQGDALDAVVACLAAGGYDRTARLPAVARREGWVFLGV